MDNQYMDMFLDESHEHLQSLNEGLLRLEENMEEISVVNDIFRNAHTLKGMSATMGFAKIAELTHEMEDVLDLVRKEQLKLNEDIMDTLFKCLDSLEQMVDSVGNGEAEDVVDVSDLVAKLSSISKGTPPPAAAPAAGGAAAAPAAGDASGGAGGDLGIDDIDLDVMKKAKDAGMNVFHVKVTLMESCVLKAARSVMVMHALDEIGDVIKSVPPAEDLEQEKFERSFDIVVATASDAEAVTNAVDTVSEI
ncbi:MAG: Hpt domain-containing protein, partial [Selenomonas sp.]|nr:Hpt domain-containing protein [Selenomonas sp.]